jgi:hypothetical protein
MGYMGLRLKSYRDSDMGHDLALDMADAIAKILKGELKDAGNEFNPSGAVHVALVNEAFFFPLRKEFARLEHDGLLAVLKSCQTKLEKEMKFGQKESNEDWCGASNKRMHMNAYERIMKKLKLTITSLEREYE